MLVPAEPGALVPVSGRPTPDMIQRELPERLSAALERVWFEDFGASGLRIAAQHRGGDLGPETRIIRIDEVRHGPDIGQSLHLLNMQNVISSLRDGSHSLIYAVRGEGQRVALYMGVRRFSRELSSASTEDFYHVLCQSLRSNYPGIVLSPEPLYPEEYGPDLIDPIRGGRCLRSVTGIPSLKSQDYAGFFAQSIDRFVDALRGEVYTLLVLAEPIFDRDLTGLMNRLRRLGEEIHKLVSVTISESRGKSQTTGTTAGESISLGIGVLLAPLFGPSIGYSVSQGRTESFSESLAASVTQETLNKTAYFCEQVLDHYHHRIQNGRNLGFWNAGVYLASDSENTLWRAQGIARSLYSGQQTHFEPLRVLDLGESDEAREALAHLRNPYLAVSEGHLHPLGGPFEGLGTPLTTEELSTLISLPSREVPGLRLKPVADFNPNPPTSGDLTIGEVIYRGERIEDSPVSITMDSLAKHTFVSGITGFGKTNTCMILLKAALDVRKPFLVIEPAKTEYRSLLADERISPPIQVFTLGDERVSPFRINPFEFEGGFNLLTHIDLLKAVFNAAFPMYASMPYILEDAILRVYQTRGWDVVSSQNVHLEYDRDADWHDYLPTLSDLYGQIDPVVKSKGYDVRLTHDLTAALKTRIQSLLLGGKGMMLDTQRSISFEAILSKPTVLELQQIGDDEEKAFVMALLLIRLYEYCRQKREGAHGQLQHLTLIEEAHRLLKNIPASISAETANTRGKAVEMFADILAEVREYGEGFIVVDQIPSKLIPDVVKNTNLKVIHRLVAQDDRAFVGDAVGLTLAQKEHLVRLPPGQAVVHNSETYTPLLVQIQPAEKDRLKSRLQQAGSALVTASIEQLRQSAGDDYRRWPGCHRCKVPCIYLSSKTIPERGDALVFSRFFASLLYSDADVVMERWQELSTRAQGALGKAYEAGYWREHAEGTLLCHLTQHTRRATATYYSYYRLHAPQTYKSLVSLQRQTMDLISTLVCDKPTALLTDQLVSIRNTFRKAMAVTPLTACPGCKLCQRRCHFGALVQVHPQMQKDERPQLVQMLTRDIRNSAGRLPLRGELGKTRQIMRAVMGFTVSCTDRLVVVPQEELPHLAYCFLANMTTNLRLLQAFQNAIRQSIM